MGPSRCHHHHISNHVMSSAVVAAAVLVLGVCQVGVVGAFPAVQQDSFEDEPHQPQLLGHLREVRSPGYLLRTRKSVADSDELTDETADEDASLSSSAYLSPRDARADHSYLFRARRLPTPGQVRDRKGGYLFRTRKSSGFYSSGKRAPSYLFRTRKSGRSSGFNSKRQGGYLFRTKKSFGESNDEVVALERMLLQQAAAAQEEENDSSPLMADDALPQRNRRDMYLFRT